MATDRDGTYVGGWIPDEQVEAFKEEAGPRGQNALLREMFAERFGGDARESTVAAQARHVARIFGKLGPIDSRLSAAVLVIARYALRRRNVRAVLAFAAGLDQLERETQQSSQRAGRQLGRRASGAGGQ